MSIRHHICATSVVALSDSQKEGLRNHLALNHSYRIVSPYCVDFKHVPVARYGQLIRAHLGWKHVDVSTTGSFDF